MRAVGVRVPSHLRHVRGVQDADGDPFASTREAIAAGGSSAPAPHIAAAREPRGRSASAAVDDGQIVEASEPYEILANVVDIAGVAQFLAQDANPGFLGPYIASSPW